LAAIIAIWAKYGKAHKPLFDGEYYRELPKTYSPAEMNYLMNKTKITSPAFLATILDLARRKHIKIEEATEIEDRLIFDKEITTYRITRSESADNALLSHENNLMNILFDDISIDGKSLTFEDIEHYARREKSFYDSWNSWSALVQSEARKQNFFEKPGKAVKYTTLIGFIMFVIGFFLFSKIPILAISVIICSLLFIIIPNSFKRRSAEAEEDYAKWKAFKRFLLDFSQMDKHEIPSLVIWEHYLVYAAALGIAKEVLKQLKIIYPDLTEGGYHFGYGWLYFSSLNRTDMMFNSFDGFSNSIEHSLRAAASKASSGSGHGGGFSAGGGGGGGGGGFGGR
jgi:uncharacterized membrane protein